MADPADIRTALADALADIPDVQVSAYNPSNPTMPSLCVIGHEQVNYGNLAFGRGDTEWNLIVRGYVAPNLDLAAQQLLDKWLADSGPFSVKAAVEADPTLDGVADWALVVRATGSQTFQLQNTVSALGTDFTVQVQTTN